MIIFVQVADKIKLGGVKHYGACRYHLIWIYTLLK